MPRSLLLPGLLPLLALCWCCSALASIADTHSTGEAAGGGQQDDPPPPRDVMIVKLGGSSITDKATFETLNRTALDWVARTIASSVHPSYRALNEESRGAESGGPKCEGAAGDGEGQCKAGTRKRGRPAPTFVIVHGAGSFGHHTAREFGLSGQRGPPPARPASPHQGARSEESIQAEQRQRRLDMTGLALTRRSVQKLNGHVVSSLLDNSVNAVGVSPCIAVPKLQAHGGNEDGGVDALADAVSDALRAGLVPVVHGDACLYGTDGAGILGGDTLVEAIAARISAFLPRGWRLSGALFLTDVDGVYTSDPNVNEDAVLLNTIAIDGKTGRILADLTASGSTHDHDVTGGLETKLGAAVNIAKAGTEVVIVRCGSTSAEQAIRVDDEVFTGTVIRLAK